jgi:homoserine dehydrogenase
VVADIVDIARANGRAVPCLGVPVAALVDKPVLPMDAVCSVWYLRLEVEDRPGVMSQLANCLGAEGISIEALIQKAPKARGSTVPVVVLTNEAREDALRRAVAQISALPAVTQPPHCIRVESD